MGEFGKPESLTSARNRTHFMQGAHLVRGWYRNSGFVFGRQDRMRENVHTRSPIQKVEA
jgi:hypothetical protein